MRLPYLQLEADFITAHSAIIGNMLRVSKNEVIGMASHLFAYAVTETSSDETPPDGRFIDPSSGLLLEAAMGWTGEAGKAIEAFRIAGILEKLEIGWRVRGMDRYRATWEKNRRRPGKKPEQNRTGTGPEPERNRAEPDRQTQTQTHEKQLVVAREPGALADGLDAIHQKHRGSGVTWNQRNQSAIRGLLAHPEPEVLRRWEIALLTPFPRCLGVFSLVEHWDAYAAPPPSTAPPRPKRDATRGYVPAQTQKHVTTGYLPDDDEGFDAAG